MTINLLIAEAKRLLTANPRDNIHDISHHQRVWENVQTIVASLESEPDMEVLKVATFWHDVMIRPESLSLGADGLFEETVSYLVTFMKEKGYDETFQAAVMEAVKHHNFLTKFQQSLEGKILFDADKLDALHPIRYRRIIANIEGKKLSKVQLFLYVKAAKLWLKTMRSRYHFDISLAFHDQLIADLLEDDEAVKVAKKFGVDIVELTK
jgi:HD superfamily phosphodiesterase